jgi:MYXO-CTERM domain-containing protein
VVFSFAFLASMAGASAASAGGGATTWDRHTHVARPVPKPAGVPGDYVLTRNGFFHPSCVITLRDDEVWGPDAVIRGLDGVVHDTITPCAYPRYGVHGSTLAEASPPLAVRSEATGHRPHPSSGTYDGWIVFFDYAGTLGTGSSLSTQWIVPLLPKNMGNQDIAFFNDFETKTLILQPVLDFSEIPGQWAIESENCCAMGNDMQSTLVAVSPGDLILGTVTATSCDSSGVCQNWTVTTKDVTTGKSTVLNTNASGEVADETNPAVLETYDITSCDMLPANGEITFFDNQLTFADGGAETVTYQFQNCIQNKCATGTGTGVAPGFPTDCGYGGKSSGNSFTLLFGTAPTPPPNSDASTGDDAGADDATVGPNDAAPGDDASASSSGGSSSGGGSGGSNSGGGSSGGNGSSTGSGGSSTGIGSSSGGLGGSGSSGGGSGGSHGSSSGNGLSASSSGFGPEPPAESSGCSCAAPGGGSGGGGLAAFALGALLLGRFGRRRR